MLIKGGIKSAKLVNTKGNHGFQRKIVCYVLGVWDYVDVRAWRIKAPYKHSSKNRIDKSGVVKIKATSQRLNI